MIYSPGLLTGKLSGLAGHTFATSNPFASIITIRRVGAPAATPAVLSQRASFANIAALYKTLSPTQLQGWHDLGLLMFVGGRLGRTYSLTGAAAFQSVNRNLFLIGAPPLSDAPALTRPASITGLALAAVGSTPGPISVVLTPTPNTVPADTAWLVYGWNAIGSSQAAPAKRSKKYLGFVGPGLHATIDITVDYLARCPAFQTGEKVSVALIPLSSVGFVGAGQIKAAIAS